MGYKVKRTLADRVEGIALDNGLSKVVVETAIRGYITSLQDDLIDHGVAVIDGVSSVRAYSLEDGDFAVSGRVSKALKVRLRERAKSR